MRKAHERYQRDVVARLTLAKAIGLKRGLLSDTTWQPLPASMLKLLVKIADAEKRLEERRRQEACKDAASPVLSRDPRSNV